MRLAIFVSLALASGVASFAASACDTRVDYSNKINESQAEYQLSVDQANRTYIEKTMYSVRSHGANLLDWSNSVNTALGASRRSPTKRLWIGQAASPSSWKTPCIASRMAW
jgi:hypothetical protein